MSPVIIRANWMELSQDGRELVLKRFDRSQIDRDKTKRLDLSEGVRLEGAVKAARTWEVVLVPDTRAPEFEGVFRSECPYRTILSIPVIGTTLLGVVNVDCSEPGRLDESILDDILDIVYLIGLVEEVRRLGKPKS
ncbi:MAG: GAF domain-containing protein [Deltaproteobacteria bacterium]|nr:GAF domain-containing protein [Deltaproteobacteria bacterium]